MAAGREHGRAFACELRRAIRHHTQADAFSIRGCFPPIRILRSNGADGGGATSEVARLRQKVELSRGIMRKLYRKNVELEKENQLLRVQVAPLQRGLSAPPGVSQSLSALPPGTADSALGRQASLNGGAGGGAASPFMQALRERDAAIEQLEQQLAAAQGQVGALQKALGMGGRAAEGLQEAVSQGEATMAQYKALRDDYRRLLNMRVETVRRAAGGKEAKVVVSELQSRLSKEIEEREAEAAIFNAKLYETEQLQSDWCEGVSGSLHPRILPSTRPYPPCPALLGHSPAPYLPCIFSLLAAPQNKRYLTAATQQIPQLTAKHPVTAFIPHPPTLQVRRAQADGGETAQA